MGPRKIKISLFEYRLCALGRHGRRNIIVLQIVIYYMELVALETVFSLFSWKALLRKGKFEIRNPSFQCNMTTIPRINGIDNSLHK